MSFQIYNRYIGWEISGATKQCDNWPYCSAVWQIYLKKTRESSCCSASKVAWGHALNPLHLADLGTRKTSGRRKPEALKDSGRGAVISVRRLQSLQVELVSWCCLFAEKALFAVVSDVLVPLLALQPPFPACYHSFPYCCQASALFLYTEQHLALLHFIYVCLF